MGDPALATPSKPVKGKSGRKLILAVAAVVLLAGGGAGAWFAGLIPSGGGHAADHAATDAERPPVFVDIPDIVANLNASGRRQVYVKLRTKLEVSRQEDAAATLAAMPRLLDLFNVFLRETRPEELRGSAGMHRMREELIARANIALKPGTVTDVLFVEIVIQ
jgi:flagellar FliL protein